MCCFTWYWDNSSLTVQLRCLQRAQCWRPVLSDTHPHKVGHFINGVQPLTLTRSCRLTPRPDDSDGETSQAQSLSLCVVNNQSLSEWSLWMMVLCLSVFQSDRMSQILWLPLKRKAWIMLTHHSFVTLLKICKPQTECLTHTTGFSLENWEQLLFWVKVKILSGTKHRSFSTPTGRNDCVSLSSASCYH